MDRMSRTHILRWLVINAVLFAVLFMGVFAGVASSVAQPAGEAKRGATLANSQCSDCHGVSGSQRSPNAAAPTFRAIAATPGMTQLALEAALASSHRQMPNLLIDRADRADIIAYILSLK